MEEGDIIRAHPLVISTLSFYLRGSRVNEAAFLTRTERSPGRNLYFIESEHQGSLTMLAKIRSDGVLSEEEVLATEGTRILRIRPKEAAE